VLAAKFAAGLFEHPYSDPEGISVLDNHDHRQLALEVARQSIVLLKNENNLLPLSRDLHSIAVIGPNADSEDNQLGGYTQYGVPVTTILEGIKRAVGPEVRVKHAIGCSVVDTDQSMLAEAVEKARNSDVAIVVVGDSKETCQESWGGRAGDRTGLDLSGGQLALVQAIHATGVSVVVVLVNGRPQSIPWVAEHVPALVEAWRPGEEGGTAVAEVLFGDVNPSGKLNFTIPRSVGQLPAYYYRKVRQYNGRKYTDEASNPLFPFGFGLSYTEFAYENLRVLQHSVPLDGEAILEVDVRNNGHRAGTEVVQLYVRDEQANVTRPMCELKGFQRVCLQPGESKTVQFRLLATELRYYDLNMDFTIEPGCHEVFVGGSSASGLTVRFAVGGVELHSTVEVPFEQNEVAPTPDVPRK
jgi:beta-glucosidase